MKHYVTALILAGGFAAAQANAACTYPTAPGKFPDGTVATKEEMLAAKGLVVKYNQDIDAYIGCITSEYEAQIAASPNATAEQKEKLTNDKNQKHDAAVKEVTEVTDRFNEQLRAWKAKNMPEKKTG